MVTYYWHIKEPPQKYIFDDFLPWQRRFDISKHARHKRKTQSQMGRHQMAICHLIFRFISGEISSLYMQVSVLVQTVCINLLMSKIK